MGKDKSFWPAKWQVVIVVIVVGVGLLAIFTDIFPVPEGKKVSAFLWPVIASIILIVGAMILARVAKILNVTTEISEKVEKIAEMAEKERSILEEINQGVHLSETAKTIAFGETDRQTLREMVLDRLQQKDFEATYEIIDDIAKSTAYQDLAGQLRAEADKYRDATDQERINQVIGHIEKLFDSYEWAKASAQIDRLIRAEPDSEKAMAMRQKLLDKKEQRKKALLAAWDEAVKRADTDRSLQILRELDLYLTANEGLALQEAARDVFRNKLHSLGVQFSLAVSDRHWAQAVQTGQQIIRDFPNSRMAEEIREKMDVLRQKAEQ